MTRQPVAPSLPAIPAPPATEQSLEQTAVQTAMHIPAPSAAQQKFGENFVRKQGGDIAAFRAEWARVHSVPARPGQTGATGVIKDGTGRIVVTGPNGKTITIDPKAGLDGDQIQEMVQTALQPATPPLSGNEIPKELIPIVAIVFPCLMLMVFAIARAITRRPVAGGGPAVLPPETVARLARIEQAVEAVAIEVERISEAQRYSAQLLTERLAPSAPALGGRTAEAPALGAQAARG